MCDVCYMCCVVDHSHERSRYVVFLLYVFCLPEVENPTAQDVVMIFCDVHQRKN